MRIAMVVLLAALMPAAARASDLPPECQHGCLAVISNLCSARANNVVLERLYDDGLHNDGAAGDGVYGVDINVDQPAGEYSWNVGTIDPLGSWPALPYCAWTGPPWSHARVWTTGPGDVIHFSMRSSPLDSGWQPSDGIACDHCRPTTSPLQVALYPYAELDNPEPSLWPATKVGNVWKAIVNEPATGTHAFLFVAADGSVAFGAAYNGSCRGAGDEDLLPLFTTTLPNTSVVFQFDESTGQVRADVLGTTPTRSRSWGSLKTIYR